MKFISLNVSLLFLKDVGQKKIYSPGKTSVFLKKQKVFFGIFHMHPINHCLQAVILASTRCLITWIIFTLVSPKVCCLQVLYA